MARNVFEELEEMLDRMSEQIEGGIGPQARKLGAIPVDVIDEGERYVVHADLPGYESDEIDLTLSGKRLSIQAERDRETETRDHDYVRREREHESIRRTVNLPEAVVEEDVSAGLDGGVLTVHLPKVHEDSGRQIEIDEE